MIKEAACIREISREIGRREDKRGTGNVESIQRLLAHRISSLRENTNRRCTRACVCTLLCIRMCGRTRTHVHTRV
jgi:hypothetical protein